MIAPGDTITLVSTSEDAISINSDNVGGSGSGSGGNRTDSSASTLHTNTSTSSSAATIIPGSSGTRPRTASQHRRTPSHSLTNLLPVPALNYVHIMTKRDTGAASNSIRTTMGSYESPASSSSTGSSSEKEQRAPITTPVQVVEQVPYAQIDFERTRALNAVNNGMGEVSNAHGHHFHHFYHQKAASSSTGGKASTMAGCGSFRGLTMRKKSDGW